jgi:hypothetical protein
MIELSSNQLKTVDQYTAGVNQIQRAQIINGIEQCLNGTWSTRGFKQHKCWLAVSEAGRAGLSPILDKWVYEANGGDGVMTTRSLKSYYKPEHSLCTPIMPAKFTV